MAPRKAASSAKSTQNGDNQKQDAIELLKTDHRKVEQLFEQFEAAGGASEKERIVEQVATALLVHTIIEEEIFYPAVRQAGGDVGSLGEAQVEHDGVKLFIRDLMASSPADEYYDAKVKVLCENVKHHVGEEEKEDDGIFAQAKERGVDTAELGQRLKARKDELMANEERVRTNPPAIRSFRNLQQQSKEYRNMPRYSSDYDYDERAGRGRDERGRFRNEEDEYGRHSRYGRSQDDYGHEDDYRGSEGQYRGSQGQGRGSHGDPEGHSRTSERGWEERSGTQSRGRYARDDDDYGRDYGRNSDYERGGGRHEHGGWYGDERGHSEASHRGWESRSGYPSRSRSEHNEDEENGYRSRGRGHGGWSGDPEGHAEASRRGWRNR